MQEVSPLRQVQQIKLLGLILLAFVTYYLAARLGLEVATINKQASPVWPATGVAISLIFLFGPRAAVGIFAGAFLSNYETGLNLPATIAIAFGNSLESLFFVWAFNRITVKESSYGVHSRAIFGIFTLVLAACISATIGSAALWVTSAVPAQAIIKNWITWWVGDFLGALFIVPIVYKIKLTNFESFKFNRFQLTKFLFVALLTTLFGRFIFASELGKPYLFLIFLPVLLAANWFGSILVYVVSLAICIFSVWQTIGGYGPFAGVSLNDSLIHLQIFLTGLSITAIGLGSLKQGGFHFKPNLALLLRNFRKLWIES